MASVNLTRAVSTVYLVHPDDLPGPDDGLEQDALLSKTDVKEETDANGQEWFLLEHADSKDLLNGQKIPVGLVSKENVELISVHNWAAFGFKTKEVASDQFIFHEDNNPLFKALCEELNGDTKDKNAPKPDVPGVSRLMHDTANHFKLSRWVYKHASEWGGEADYKKQVKDFLENGAQDSEDAKEMARRKYDRLEAKIANLSWWKEVSKKVKDFPSSPVVYHFNPAAFLEQMRRVEENIYDSVAVVFQSGLGLDRQEVVSNKTIVTLKRLGYLSGNSKIQISSTIRSPERQVDAMYNNLQNGNRIRYGAPGRKVVAVYDSEVSKGSSVLEIKSEMVKKVKELQEVEQLVSLHCVSLKSYQKLNVIDVSISGSGFTDVEKFLEELSKEEVIKRVIHPIDNIEVSSKKLVYDPNEPAIHIEVAQ